MSSIQEKIDSFKEDLKNSALSNIDIVRKNICFGTPYIFKDCESYYYDLKKEIGDYFGVRPSDVIMVGSGKLGFSISPTKIWRPINDESDIDMVIISEVVFDKFWKELYQFNIDIEARSEKEDKLYRQFLEYFLCGWLRPDKLPFAYESKDDWFSFFKSISYTKYDKRKVTGAVYRDYFFFENYHINNIKNIRNGGYSD